MILLTPDEIEQTLASWASALVFGETKEYAIAQAQLHKAAGWLAGECPHNETKGPRAFCILCLHELKQEAGL